MNDAPPHLFEPEYERLPPANSEAEQCLIAAILANNLAYEKVADFLLPEHFADPLNGEVYEACRALIERGKTASVVSLKRRFADEKVQVQDEGDLDVAAYLAGLAGAYVALSDVRHYGEVIHQLWQARQIIEAAGQALDDAYRTDGLEMVPSTTIEALQTRVDAIQAGKQDGHEIEAYDAGRTWIDEVEAAMKARHENRIIGVATGIPGFDRRTGGFRPKKLIIGAGATSQFKSALAAFTARNAVLTCRDGMEDPEAPPPATLVYSAEMGAPEYMSRILAMDTGIPYQDQANGNITDEQWRHLDEAARRWKHAPLVFNDRPNMAISALWSRARRLYRQRGLRLIVVDYIQLMVGSDSRSREREVASITNQLKQMSGEFEVPVLALSQLSRKLLEREDKRPNLGDLRESGAIEQDADAVIFTHYPHFWMKQERPVQKPRETDIDFRERRDKWGRDLRGIEGLLDLIVAKWRGGQAGYTSKAHVHAPTAVFSDPVAQDEPAAPDLLEQVL